MPLPALGAAVPRRGNVVTRGCGRLLLGLLGWRLIGAPPDLPRFILIVAPHTSNWDFVVGIAARLALDLDAHWLGKHTLFRGPWAGLLYWLRGIPVNRSAPQGMIGQLAGRVRASRQFVLALAPEGTRGKVTRWKSGFYFIAMQAEVPVVPVALDYAQRTIAFGQPFSPTGHLEQDLAALQAFYAGVTPRHPDNY